MQTRVQVLLGREQVIVRHKNNGKKLSIIQENLTTGGVEGKVLLLQNLRSAINGNVA
jgi:hypothetical protein